jgi:hypothetical protein
VPPARVKAARLVKSWLLSRCVLVPRRGRQGRSSFCEQKEAKKLQDGASRVGVGELVIPARPALQADEVFCALFYKKAPLAC